MFYFHFCAFIYYIKALVILCNENNVNFVEKSWCYKFKVGSVNKVLKYSIPLKKIIVIKINKDSLRFCVKL